MVGQDDEWSRAVEPVGAIVAFVGVSDLDQAQAFYGATLGLRLTDERPYALVADVSGTMLRITQVDTVVAAQYTVLGWDVPDIEVAVDDLARRGVTFLSFDGMAQDERGVWTAPGVSRVAWFRDPDGNTLSLTEFASPSSSVAPVR